jgi:hypothetical protein
MATFTSEGTIEIDLVEFWNWVCKEHLPVAPVHGAEIRYGVPRVNKDNMTLDIDFAASTDCNPADWIQKPKAVTQWNELERASTVVKQGECFDTGIGTSEDGTQTYKIDLRVSKTFYEAVKILAEEEGIAKSDLIRKAVCHYAKAQVERINAAKSKKPLT